MVSTSDKVLSVLRLFSSENPEWSVEAAALELAVPHSTAYSYFRSLVNSELIAPVGVGRYVLGPAVIEMDRVARASDPMLVLGGAVLDGLVGQSPVPVVALLCRLYRMKVMCVDQRSSAGADFAVSYERGRLMPLFRGAASKVVLANVERRRVKRFFDENQAEVAASGLGGSWSEFRLSLRRIRANDVYVTWGELDPGRVGLSVPLLSAAGASVGSLSLVVAETDYRASAARRAALHAQLLCAASALNQVISAQEAAA